MKQCEACNVSIKSIAERCPLCYSTLDDKDGESSLAYPNITVHDDEYNLFLRIFVFASVVIAAVCVTIDFLTPSKYPWSLVVVASVCYIWVSVGTLVKRHRKIGFNLMMQVVSVALMLVILGIVFNFSYFVYNYVLPALFVSAMLSFNIIAIIKYRDIKNFILYSLIVSLFGFVPLILFLFNLVQVRWTMVSSAVFSVLSIIAMFIFAGRATTTELQKRFHI